MIEDGREMAYGKKILYLSASGQKNLARPYKGAGVLTNGKPRSPRRISFFALLFMLAIYAAAAHVRGIEGSSGVLAKLTDAYLAGQTSLLEMPPPALLQQKFPFILPSCKIPNEFSRFDDHVLFDGKLYLPYGPVPLLLAFVPYKFFFGKDLSLAFVSWLFACIGTITILSMYRQLWQRLQWPEKLFPFYTPYLLVAGPFILIVLSWGEHYKVFLTAVYAFVALGLQCFLQATVAGTLKKECMWLALFSLCLGLAAGCRLHFALLGTVLGIYGLSLLHRQRFHIQALAKLSCLLLPWAVCIFGLLYYNYIRFGSFLDTGVQYQVTCRSTTSTVGGVSAAFIPYNLYFYLLHPIVPDFSSPPLFKMIPPAGSEFRVPWQTSFDFTTQEPVYGLINLPFVFFAFAALTLRRSQSAAMNSSLRWLWIFLWIIPLILFPILLIMSATLRYVLDFTPWLMLLACMGYGHLLVKYQHDEKRLYLWQRIGFIAAFYTLAVNLL